MTWIFLERYLLWFPKVFLFHSIVNTFCWLASTMRQNESKMPPPLPPPSTRPWLPLLQLFSQFGYPASGFPLCTDGLRQSIWIRIISPTFFCLQISPTKNKGSTIFEDRTWWSNFIKLKWLSWQDKRGIWAWFTSSHIWGHSSILNGIGFSWFTEVTKATILSEFDRFRIVSQSWFKKIYIQFLRTNKINWLPTSFLRKYLSLYFFVYSAEFKNWMFRSELTKFVSRQKRHIRVS